MIARFLCAALLLLSTAAFAQPTTAPVKVETLSPSFLIRGSSNGLDYALRIANDGAMSNVDSELRDMVDSSLSTSRGAYVHQKGFIPADTVAKQGENVIVAGSQRYDLKYTFGGNSILIELKNKTDSPMRYRFVPNVNAKHLIDETGKAYTLPTPATKSDWKEFTLVSDTVSLNIKGGGRSSGIFELSHSAIDLFVEPNETKTFELQWRRTTDAMRASIARADAPPAARPIDVVCPLDYQVMQRQLQYSGPLRIEGKLNVEADTVIAIVSDVLDAETKFGAIALSSVSATTSVKTRWEKIELDRATQAFHGTLTVPAAGWFKVGIAAMKDGKRVAFDVVDHVGMGEVFVGAGQSNSTNYGDGGKLKSQTGLVTAFSGTSWQLCEDPQPGAHDASTMGSFWPAFGDAMVEKYHVPIGVVVTGHGGTSTNQWRPGDDLFNWTLIRLGQLGPHGFRAVLWHQGETDAFFSADEYHNAMSQIIHGFHQMSEWDFPFFVAQVSYRTPEQPKFDAIREGQKKLWDDGTALQGPDTDALTGDMRDHDGKGIHFSVKGREAHGKLWAEKVGGYLDKVFEGEK